MEVEAAYYGAPPGWIGRRVKVQWDQRCVRLLDPRTGQLLREHLRQQRGHHRIQDQDRPAHAPRSTQQLLARCEKAGSHIGALCQLMYREQGVVAIRRIQGILGLARKHGAALTGDGCAAALEIGVRENPIASSAAGWNAAPNSRCGRSTPSSASSLFTATSSTTRPRRTPHEPHRTPPLPAPTPPRRHGRCPRNPLAPSPSRTHGAD